MLWKIAILQFFFMHLESKEGRKKDYMNSTGGKLRRQEKEVWVNQYDWIKVKWRPWPGRSLG